MVLRQSRLLIGIIGLLMCFATMGYLVQFPLMADLWPWTSYTVELEPLSFLFLGSIAAAIAVALLWIAVSGNLQVAPAGALNLMVTFGGIAGYLFKSYQADPSNGLLLLSAILMAISALGNIGVFFLTRKLPPVDLLPLPKPIRYSFCLFVVTLVLVGGAMVLGAPNVFPWKISPEGSVVYGWIFLGDALFFAYAVAKPLWENATAPLLSFLAYDLVLIVPFIEHFAQVEAHQRLSLIVYTSVIVYSGLLSCYYLFVHPSTRLFASCRRQGNPLAG